MSENGYEERAEARANALVQLAWESIPRSLSSSKDHEDWNVFVPATVARCAHILESILALCSRQQDGAILLRALFEHVIAFAWVAIEPQTRLSRLVANDYEHRLKANGHLVHYGGTAMDGKTQQHFQARVERARRGLPASRSPAIARKGVKAKLLPDVLNMAGEADSYWHRVHPDLGLQGRYSLSGQYVIYYRWFSQYVHPTIMGLEPFVYEEDGFLRVGRPTQDAHSCASSGGMLLSIMLFLTSDLFKWPDAGRIAAIHGEFPT
jgi:hypothetical protein